MDGAITSVGAEPIRRLPAGSPLALSAEAKSLHSGLFEQILSLPAPSRSRREEFPSADALHDSDRDDPTDEEAIAVESPKQSGAQAVGEEVEGEAEAEDDEEALELSAAVNLAAADLVAQSIADTSTECTQSATDVSEAAEAASESVALPATDAMRNQEPEVEALSPPAGELPEEVAVVGIEDPAAENGEEPNSNKPDLLAADDPTKQQLRQAGQRGEQPTATGAELPVAGVQTEAAQAANADADLEELPVDDAKAEAEPQVQSTGAASVDAKRSQDGRREKWYQREAESEAAPEPSGNESRGEAPPSRAQVSASTLTESSLQAAAHASQSPAEAMAESISLPASDVPTGAAVLAAEEGTSTSIIGANSSTTPLARQTDDAGSIESMATSGSSTGSNSRSQVDESKAGQLTRPAGDLSQQERVRLVQRISRSFARLGPMGGQINLKLHPPQLGSLSVQVRLEGRSLTAKLSTESAAARDAILESLPVLRGRLAEQGFEISQFQVEVADNQADAASGGNPDQNMFGHSERDGQRQGSQVDYRRIAMIERQRLESGFDANTPLSNRPDWQAMAGLDLHA